MVVVDFIRRVVCFFISEDESQFHQVPFTEFV